MPLLVAAIIRAPANYHVVHLVILALTLQGFGRTDLKQNVESKQWEMITIDDARSALNDFPDIGLIALWLNIPTVITVPCPLCGSSESGDDD